MSNRDDYTANYNQIDQDSQQEMTYGSVFGGNLPEGVASIIQVVHERKYQFTVTGLDVQEELSSDEWRNIFIEIKALKRAYQWIIGDWMLYGFDRNWTTTYEDMAKLTGLSWRTVEQFTYVCRNVPVSIRIETLSFGHFQLIAALKADKQQHWIDRAVKEKLSVRGLRAAMSGDKIENPPPLLSKANRRRMNRIWSNMLRGTYQKIHDDDIYEMRKWLDLAEKERDAKLKK